MTEIGLSKWLGAFSLRKDQSCSTCNAYSPNLQHNPKTGQVRQGWCRANAPVVIQVVVQTVTGPQGGTQGVWPTTASDQWCRQWEPMEDEDGN